MKHQHGFTLIELAIVLVILGLLLGSMVPTLSGQMEQRRIQTTRQQLDEAQQALLGYAIAQGRLPCPASDSSNGQESFCSSDSGNCTVTTTPQAHGRCSHPLNGYLPAVTLTLTPQDDQGYLLDSWGNRLRYAVADHTINGIPYAFTRTNGISQATISQISNATLLYLCDAAPSSTINCGSNIKLTDKTPAVFFSTGPKHHASNDENANLDNNRIFVSHSPNTQYDDLVMWLSPAILFNRLVAAGKLP